MIMDWSQMCAMEFYFEGPDRLFIAGGRALLKMPWAENVGHRRTSDHFFKTATTVHPPLPSIVQLDNFLTPAPPNERHGI
jgi:hypothetical protein